MEKQQSKTKIWFSTKMVPFITSLGSQRHLASLRDAFGTLIPLTLAGSLGLIMSGIVFGGSGSGYVSLLGLICKAAHPELEWNDVSNYIAGVGDYAGNGFNKTMLIGWSIFSQLNTITIGMTALWFAFTFGYFLGLTKNFKNPIIAGFASLMGFLATTMGQVSFFQGAEGLISALFFGIISTELFMYLCNVKALYIKMPDGVPPSVSKSFAVFLPFIITVGGVALFNLVFIIPAVLGAEWTVVTKASFTTFTGEDLDKFIAINKVDGSLSTALEGTFTKGDSATLITELQAIFTDSTSTNDFVTRLSKLYSDKSETDQATISTMLAVLNGLSPSSIRDLHDAASVQFINANGVDIIMSKYVVISIKGESFGWSAAIYQFFVSLLLAFATGNGGLGLALVYVFFISFLWFFGVHGSNVVNGAFTPIWSMIGTINLTLITSLGYDAAVATDQMGVFSGMFFDTFVNLGGSGATITLILATLVFSRKQEMRRISAYAAPSGIFQINEPILFGFPIVLNPFYVVPFILAPMFNVLIGWMFSPDAMNLYGYAQISVPWTTPFFIAAIIVYLSPKALIPALIVTGVSFAIYLPFVLLDNIMYFRKLKKTNLAEYNKEMQYYNDPRFKFEYKTGIKYEGLIEKSEIVINNAHSQIRYWETKMTDQFKINERKEKLLKEGELKKEFYIKEAEEFKRLRKLKEEVYTEKWDNKKVINYLKIEMWDKLAETKDPEAKKALREEYKAKINDLKVKNKENKEELNSKIVVGKQKLNEEISISKAKFKEQKSILKEKLKEMR